MAAPKEILRLLERFAQQREAYQSGQYKELPIRVEFIDPFFKALGWDVHNEQGYAEAAKHGDPNELLANYKKLLTEIASARDALRDELARALDSMTKGNS